MRLTLYIQHQVKFLLLVHAPFGCLLLEAPLSLIDVILASLVFLSTKQSCSSFHITSLSRPDDQIFGLHTISVLYVCFGSIHISCSDCSTIVLPHNATRTYRRHLPKIIEEITLASIRGSQRLETVYLSPQFFLHFRPMTGILPADALAIGVGAFMGAICRYQTGRVAAEYIASDPKRLGHLSGWHTAAINVGGSFLLGGVTATPLVSKTTPGVAGTPSLGLTARHKLLLGVGFCGSFTTFSSYSVDVVQWLSQGKTTRAIAYIFASNVGGVAAAAAGLMVVKKIFGA